MGEETHRTWVIYRCIQRHVKVEKCKWMQSWMGMRRRKESDVKRDHTNCFTKHYIAQHPVRSFRFDPYDRQLQRITADDRRKSVQRRSMV